MNTVKRMFGMASAVALMLACLAPLSASATTYTTGSLRIMSANLKTTTGIKLIDTNVASPATGTTPNYRAQNFAALVALYLPDSIGMQEVAKGTISGQSWNAWFNDNLGTGLLVNYASTGKTSDYATSLYGDALEYCLILYRKDKYTLLNSGGIWIGNNPASSSLSDVFTSTDSSGNAIAMNHSRVISWALLQNTTTGASYLHVNCHPDTRLAGGIGLMQTDIIVKKVQALVALYNVPVVLTGDFNFDELTDDETAFNAYYNYLTNVTSYNGLTSGLIDGKYATTDRSSVGTACGYASAYTSTSVAVLDRVCFMNASKILSLSSMSSYSYSVTKSRVVRSYTYGGVAYDTKYISDHSPVYTDLSFTYVK